MAEIKEENGVVTVNKSTIKKIKEPDFSKEVVIDRIHLISKRTFDQHYEMMKKTFGDKLSDEEIAKRINSLVVRDAVFNEAMKIIVPCYEIKINDEDLTEFANFISKQDTNLLNYPREYVENIARRSIEKDLVFVMLGREWNITVSDEDAKNVLMSYYKATNNSIRDKLNDANELAKIKSTLYEQAIANKICTSIKTKMDWDAINKHAEEDKAAAEEAFKKMQEAQQSQTKKEEKK